VQKEPSDKFHRCDGDCFSSLFLSILKGEGNHAIFNLFDAAVGNSYSMGIAGQVFDDMFRAFDRLTHAVYHCAPSSPPKTISS